MRPAIHPWALEFGIAVTLAIAAVRCQSQTSSAQYPRQTAIAMEQQGRLPEAEAAWQAQAKAHPSDAEAWAHLGFLEAHQEHYKEAVPLYRKALAINPSMPGLKMNLGLALFKGDDLKPAIQIFEPLLKNQTPGSPEAVRLKTLLGMAHYGLSEYTAAIPYLKEAAAADPQNLPFRLILAHSCLGAKQYQCVLDVYHEILTLNAESAEADMLAGEALDAMQDHDGAIQQFRAAVKANPQEPDVHFGLGYLLWGQGKFDEAATEFQAELTNVPNNAQAMAYLADANIKLGHPDEARPLLEKATQINPEMELPHLDLGILYSDANHHDDALRELETAARLAPADVNVHYRLARLLKVMGKTEEANAEFQKTSNLHKQANATIFEELGKAQAKGKPSDTESPAPPSN